MSVVGFLPVHLQGFYGWLIFVRSWIYFFESHIGFSEVCCRFWVLCGFVVGHYDFGCYGCKCYTLVVFGKSEVPLFREGEYASLHPSIYRILIVYCVAVSEQYVVELSGLLYFWGNLVQPYIGARGVMVIVVGNGHG